MMWDFVALLLSHDRVSEWWMDYCNLCTMKDHALCKSIDYLNLREQINFMCLLMASKQIEKKLLDPDAGPFAPNVESIHNEDQSS